MRSKAHGRHTFRLNAILGAVVSFTWAIDSYAQLPHRLEAALTAWQAKQIRWKTARYRLEGTGFIPRHSRVYPDFTTRFPNSDHSFPHTIDLCLDFTKHRASRRTRRDIFDISLGRFITEVTVDLFDGTEYQEYVPRDENLSLRPDLPEFNNELIFRGTKRTSAFFRAEEVPLLLNLGFVPVDIVEPTLLPAELDRSRYQVRNDRGLPSEGTFVVRIDSADANANRYSEVIVDANKGYSITQEVRYHKGAEYWRVEIELGARESDWVPIAWQILSADPSGALDGQDEFVVAERKFDETIADSEFRQAAKPGMIVKDLATNRRYLVGMPGERHIPIEELASRRANNSPSPFLRAIIAIIVLALVAILYYQHAWRSSPRVK